MDIQQAKQQIKNAMLAYFAKDEFGNYRLPTERQRPVFLLGAPGIGKTAIMEQIAQELDVGFVSYSMTHHTRQSALGLPFIAKKTYGDVEYDVSEYTMSEIIAAVYDAMEATGHPEGILFLDEINCVSETLTPAMLQFLQYKVFGRHRVPDGWIVVTAGNPPEYNRTAHDFDIATWDRLKRIDVEPDFAAWRAFAVETGVHPAVLTYLDIERDHFYRVETTVDGKSFVTARGWDDLSAMVKLYEEQGIPVDELLVGQYVQNAEIAKRFSVYYDLFSKYRADYQIDRILAGEADEGIVERARAAAFDERVSLMGLVTDALGGRVRDAVLEERAVAFAHARLATMRDVILSGANGVSAVEGSPAATAIDAADALPLVRKETAALQRRLDAERASGLLSDEKYLAYERTLALLDRAQRVDATGSVSFSQVKNLFGEMVDALDARIADASAALDHAFRFVEDAFGEGQEMLLLVTDLSANGYGMAFINDHGCERYFAHNEALLFNERGSDLADRINQLDLSEE
ncbi:ATP-binding protein [Gordonibacter massiliensis (ex Traore et al. 2017)]|uniref:ATP-binding protein n=1 Tax=Gordonibacter massiliensis (ex Traore et al. 2017) TaxID=1841863 RepID=UPI001C8CADBC|nr:MoxR family ATPase [Gordonibacter massiliensis (ex Traore et al. 2017)]MBX9034137.1 AAA family ATPase [Gordonibacter massiliensis (ex Traore et al. 2017)]